MTSKYYIVHGAGDIWTIACPQCHREERTLKKNLHARPAGDWALSSPRECACGFTSQLLADVLESEEIKKTKPTPTRGDQIVKWVGAVFIVVIGYVVVVNYINSREAATRKAAEQRAQEAKARWAATEISISLGEVAVGMSADEVKRSWGAPRAVNITQTSLRRSEQWVYPRGYVYLTNGTVTAVQIMQ